MQSLLPTNFGHYSEEIVSCTNSEITSEHVVVGITENFPTWVTHGGIGGRQNVASLSHLHVESLCCLEQGKRNKVGIINWVLVHLTTVHDSFLDTIWPRLGFEQRAP